MDELMDAVDGRLENDNAYLAQREATDQAIATAEAAAEKARTSELDRENQGQGL